jgi:hypothetical protein
MKWLVLLFSFVSTAALAEQVSLEVWANGTIKYFDDCENLAAAIFVDIKEKRHLLEEIHKYSKIQINPLDRYHSANASFLELLWQTEIDNRRLNEHTSDLANAITKLKEKTVSLFESLVPPLENESPQVIVKPTEHIPQITVQPPCKQTNARECNRCGLFPDYLEYLELPLLIVAILSNTLLAFFICLFMISECFWYFKKSQPRITNPVYDLDNNCVICLDSFGEKPITVTRKCHHVFHSDCYHKWERINNRNCPYCNSTL